MSKAVAEEVKVGVTNVIKPELKKIEEAVAKDQRNTYAEVLKKAVEDKLEERLPHSGGFHEHVANKTEVVEEYVDRQNRKANVVISNIPEPDMASFDDRRQHDWETVDKMFQALHLKIEVKKVSRIGRKQEGQTRLLLVTLGSEDLKWEVLRVAKHLREFEEFFGVYVNPDLTKSEREINKKLREEAKERREKGEDVVVYKGKVVKRTMPRSNSGDHAANYTRRTAN